MAEAPSGDDCCLPETCGGSDITISRRRLSDSDLLNQDLSTSNPSSPPPPVSLARKSIDLSSSGEVQAPKKRSAVKKTLEGFAGDMLKKRRGTTTSIRGMLLKKNTSSCPVQPLRGMKPSSEARDCRSEASCVYASSHQNSISDSPLHDKVDREEGIIGSLTSGIKRHSVASLASYTIALQTDACSVTANDDRRVNSNGLSQSEGCRTRVALLKQRLAILRGVLDERQVAHSNMEAMLESFGLGPEGDGVKGPRSCAGFTADQFDATLGRNYTLVPGDEETQLAKGSLVSVSGYLASTQRWRFTSSHRVSVLMHAVPSTSDFSCLEGESAGGSRSSGEDLLISAERSSSMMRPLLDNGHLPLDVEHAQSLTHGQSSAFGGLTTATMSLPREPSLCSLPSMASGFRARSSSTISSQIYSGSLPHSLHSNHLEGINVHRLSATTTLMPSCSQVTMSTIVMNGLPCFQYDYPLLGSLPRSVLDTKGPEEDDNSDGDDSTSRTLRV